MVVIGIGLSGFLIFIKNRKNEVIQRIKEVSRSENIVFSDKFANYFGRESKKYKQVRGNGTLVITDTTLMFFMLLPKKEVHIELSKIDDIESPVNFIGKSVFKPLLKINYLDESNKKDSAAWLVKDLELAKKFLQERGGKT